MMFALCSLLVLIAIAFSTSIVCAEIVLSLDGPVWTLTNTNKSISVPATVPGNVYSDLMTANVIGSPSYRFNEDAYRWIPYEPMWTYTLTFDIPSSLLSSKHRSLVFDGIDTIADVTINGVEFSRTENMFRRYSFDITSLTKASGNTLVVSIYSPVLYAGNYSASYPYPLPVADPANEIPFRNFIRKAQSDFGWDWGIGLAPSGIWKSVRIIAYNTAVIADVTAISTPLNTTTPSAQVNLTAFIRVAPQASGATGTLIMIINGQSASAPFSLLPSPLADTEFVQTVNIIATITDIALWWPQGYGAQPLYDMTVTLKTDDGDMSAINRTIGFRTIEIVREPIDGETGLTFYFRVNGVPVYAKGANLVPFDALHTRVTETNISRILQSAVDANHNIVRVWGGGIYQSDFVYDFADRNGLMVWQEFAFACGMYPVNDFFLNNVRTEVTQIMRRLNTHTSIAVFGGNNENEVALNWFDPTKNNRDLYLIDYNNLYVNTIRDALMRELGYSVEFVVSSPSNGPLSLAPFVQRWGDGGSALYGDVHFYNYDDDCSDVNIYPRARFVSEFGFQSEPSLITYIPDTLPADRSLNSSLMLYRQHHEGGNEQMAAQMRRHFIEPNANTDFDDWNYLTQATQSICYSTAIQHWRRIKSEQGRTYGVIYWQLNDLWSAPTWASIEWGARWKMLHYTTKAVFAPIIVSPYLMYDGGSIGVYIASDLTEQFQGTVVMELRQWTDGKVLNDIQVNVDVPKLFSKPIYNTTLTKLTSAFCRRPTDCFLKIYALSGCATVATNTLWLGPIKNATLTNPNVTVVFLDQVHPIAKPLPLSLREQCATTHHNMKAFAANADSAKPSLVTSASVQLTAVTAAPYVWLETTIGGYFSDNGFLLLPEIAETITFSGYEPFDQNEFVKTLRVRSIYDTLTKV